MTIDQHSSDHLFRMWELGQQHLVEGLYRAACRALEVAEGAAWRRRDARSLARIYLPLLEARRQIRYLAAEGVLIVTSDAAAEGRAACRMLLEAEAGTVLLGVPASRGRNIDAALRFAESIRFAAARTGRKLEALLLLGRGQGVRMVSPADAYFAAGLGVRVARSETDLIGASTEANLVVPLPPAGLYEAKGATQKYHALIRESLIIGWEALALRWQHRHPLRSSERGVVGAWEEMAWLRRALEVDPACEPVSMRLIAVAEAVQRL